VSGNTMCCVHITLFFVYPKTGLLPSLQQGPLPAIPIRLQDTLAPPFIYTLPYPIADKYMNVV